MRELKLLKLSKSSNRGITLIALVITIIVLLILAGVSIAMLTGENGILTQANNVKSQTVYAEAEEQMKLAYMSVLTEISAQTVKDSQYNATTAENIAKLAEIVRKDVNADGTEWIVTEGTNSITIRYNNTAIDKNSIKEGKPANDGYVEGVITIGSQDATFEFDVEGKDPEGDTAVVGEIVTGKNKEYTTEDGTAVIPVGFAIVPGLDDISEGLVISDVANDTGDTGNQFVWIPVSKENFEEEFVRRAGKYIYNGKENTQDITNYGEANATGNNTNTSIEESLETQAEAIAMYDSVEENGGFYIGRYEAGTTADSGTGIRGNVVSKKGANVYNNIGWNNDTTNNSITNESGGAVEVARSFAEQNNYDITQVHSTLCYSVQWDTALNFIDPGYKGYAKDSTGKGWYSDNYNSTETGNTETNPNQITGKDLIYTANPNEIANAPKNIYDMGGNAFEWTMEAYYASSRASRGGDYFNTGSVGPASYRYSYFPSDSYSTIGFRLALYL